MPPSEESVGGEAPAATTRYTATEFAAQFQASFRVFWLIAIGIVGDAAIAEDIVQEAALTALSKLDQFRPGTNYNAWMGRIVCLIAKNRARKERTRQTTPLDQDSSAQAAPREDSADRARLLVGRGEGSPTHGHTFDRRLERALLGVNSVARACLLLRTVEEMKYSDIARLLDIPEGTAMSHVHRTRRSLREQLGGFRSAGSAADEENV